MTETSIAERVASSLMRQSPSSVVNSKEDNI